MPNLQRPIFVILTTNFKAHFKATSLKTKVPNPRTKLYSAMLAAVLAISMLVGFPNPAFATDTATPMAGTGNTPADIQAEPQTQQTNMNDIADEKIERFSQAYLQVLQLLSDRAPDLSAAKSADEATNVQQAIEADAVALIQDSGLTLPEYMQILESASQDTTFRDKVFGKINESSEQ